MNRLAKITLPVLALALASAHADAAGVMLRRPVITNMQTAPIPANAETMAAKIRPRLTPWGAQWARAEAQKLSSGQISPDAVSGDAQSACGGQSACFDFVNMPIEDAMLLMMMLINNDAEQDMRDQLADMQRRQQEKQAQRAAKEQMREQQQSMRQQMQNEQDAKDSLGEMGENKQMQMHALMDRREKALRALSEAMKKYDDTSDTIIKNMK